MVSEEYLRSSCALHTTALKVIGTDCGQNEFVGEQILLTHKFDMRGFCSPTHDGLVKS